MLTTDLRLFTSGSGHSRRSLIVRFLGKHTPSSTMREFKKFTARQIIRQFEAEGNKEVLAFFEQMAVHFPRQRYKVWEDGYDARDVFSPAFLRQKAAYCHDNPCQPQWQLVEGPEQYPWSSARFYLLGEPAIIPVDDLSELLA